MRMRSYLGFEAARDGESCVEPGVTEDVQGRRVVGVEGEAGGCPDSAAPADHGSEVAAPQQDVVGAVGAEPQGRQVARQHSLPRLYGELGLGLV